MRRLDLQKIRGELGLTQVRVAEMTGYPQGFVSQVERGKVSCPEGFIEKLQEVYGLPNISEYVFEEEENKEPEAVPEVSEEKSTIKRLFDLVERREARIEKLEAEIEQLRAENAELRERVGSRKK